MMPSTLPALARERARPYYDDALPAHGIFHATRVRAVACQLATQHPATVDQDLLAAAAWLHDIGRPRERVGEIDDHGDWAASGATRLLDAEAVQAEQISAIEHCLRAHSIRASSPAPRGDRSKPRQHGPVTTINGLYQYFSSV